MLSHPGTELQLLIKEKGLTQKAFSAILGKKVSEVNELLKGKRNITIQRDYLLHQTLGTPIKYRILKQIDYDYSLLDIENISLPVRGAAEQSEAEGLSEPHSHPEHSEESNINNLNSLDSSTSLRSSLNDNITQNENKSQETPAQKPKNENDEDLKNRAKIFRTF